MKNTISLMLVVAFVAVFSAARGQYGETPDVIGNGVYEKVHTVKRVPVPFEYLREADVAWSKTIWREIDVREKVNQVLYYPEEPMDGRISLIDLILFGVENLGLKAYDPTAPENEFKQELTIQEIMKRFDAGFDTVPLEQEDGSFKDTVMEQNAITWEVKRYMIKELWFFDRQRSVLDVRIIGICPIRLYYKKSDVEETDLQQRAICWIYYPDFRQLFANHEVFNVRNDAERRSFDDILIKRYFSSYIVKESNVYGNRGIGEYAIGIEAMLESERIKNTIFNFEQDIWEY